MFKRMLLLACLMGQVFSIHCSSFPLKNLPEGLWIISSLGNQNIIAEYKYPEETGFFMTVSTKKNTTTNTFEHRVIKKGGSYIQNSSPFDYSPFIKTKSIGIILERLTKEHQKMLKEISIRAMIVEDDTITAMEKHIYPKFTRTYAKTRNGNETTPPRNLKKLTQAINEAEKQIQQT